MMHSGVLSASLPLLAQEDPYIPIEGLRLASRCCYSPRWVRSTLAGHSASPNPKWQAMCKCLPCAPLCSCSSAFSMLACSSTPTSPPTAPKDAVHVIISKAPQRANNRGKYRSSEDTRRASTPTTDHVLIKVYST
eukprot:3917731-Pyramimonas_sp.AAC.1